MASAGDRAFSQPLQRPIPKLVVKRATNATNAEQDRKLVQRLLIQGDDEALAHLFERHAPSLLPFLRCCLGQKEDAEEVLQETFLQVWRQASRYRPQVSSPRTWLFAIARSRAIDRIRSRSSTKNREERFHREGAITRAPEDVHHLAQLSEYRGTLLAALSRLPDSQRECVRLAFVQGLSHRQIALHLGAPLGTVKSRILHGLRRLRAFMAERNAA